MHTYMHVYIHLQKNDRIWKISSTSTYAYTKHKSRQSYKILPIYASHLADCQVAIRGRVFYDALITTAISHPVIEFMRKQQEVVGRVEGKWRKRFQYIMNNKKQRDVQNEYKLYKQCKRRSRSFAQSNYADASGNSLL